jgi:hypothetical protein
MGTALPGLPEELLLEIGSNIADLKNMGLVSKQLCHVSACVAVQRSRDNSSLSTLYEALRTLRCLAKWTETQTLAENLCGQIRDQFIKEVHERSINDALRTLQSLDRLPTNAAIPKKDFLAIVETIRIHFQTKPKVTNINWFFPIDSLIVLSRLRVPTKIPKNWVLELIGVIRSQIVQDLKNGRHYFSSIMLRDVGILTLGVNMPNNFFSIVLETIRERVIECVDIGRLEDARATLQVLRYIPADIIVPNDYFLGVVEAIRNQLEGAMIYGVYDTSKLLWVLTGLPLNTRIPNNYFTSAIAYVSSRLRSIEYGTTCNTFMMLCMLRFRLYNVLLE